jgi:phosphopantothenoylcysteine decarboxylase/phosphopantothenate--cysteine ligase
MPWCDVLIMAAAVADWRPRLIRSQKIKKFNGVMSLELEPAPDILQSIRSMKGGRIIVGFAAETENLIAEAQAKMARKGLDLIVANDVTQSDAGFEVDTNRVVMIAAGCAPEPLPLMSKEDVAGKILEWVEAHGRHC